MATLLSPVENAKGLVDGIGLRIEDSFVRAEVEALSSSAAGGFQTHTAPTPLPSNREPSVQIGSRRCPHSLAVWRAPPLFSTMICPGKSRWALYSWSSIDSPGHKAAAARRRVVSAAPSLAMVPSRPLLSRSNGGRCAAGGGQEG